MSRVFVGLNDGSYLNLDEISRLYEADRYSEIWRARTRDGKEHEVWPAPEHLVIQVIPCTTPMHLVMIWDPGEDKPCELTWEPVIGWGLTIMGNVVPITPTESAGPGENLTWGLREPGTEEIMVPFDGTYADFAAWSVCHKKFMAEKRKIQAAHDKKKKATSKKPAKTEDFRAGDAGDAKIAGDVTSDP